MLGCQRKTTLTGEFEGNQDYQPLQLGQEPAEIESKTGNPETETCPMHQLARRL